MSAFTTFRPSDTVPETAALAMHQVMAAAQFDLFMPFTTKDRAEFPDCTAKDPQRAEMPWGTLILADDTVEVHPSWNEEGPMPHVFVFTLAE